jgi:hypothetical protein
LQYAKKAHTQTHNNTVVCNPERSIASKRQRTRRFVDDTGRPFVTLVKQCRAANVVLEAKQRAVAGAIEAGSAIDDARNRRVDDSNRRRSTLADHRRHDVRQRTIGANEQAVLRRDKRDRRERGGVGDGAHIDTARPTMTRASARFTMHNMIVDRVAKHAVVDGKRATGAARRNAALYATRQWRRRNASIIGRLKRKRAYNNNNQCD